MEYTSLFTNNHELNYDEAVRRLRYWIEPAENDKAHAFAAVRLLIDLLHDRRKQLTFEQ